MKRSIGWSGWNHSLVLALALGLGVAVGPAGCSGSSELDGQLEPEDEDPLAQDDGKYEAWNQANNPAYVDPSFVYYAHQLPVAGEGPTPIPGDYWAVARDVLNAKWDNGMSPAEKYAKAFNKPGTQEQVSKAHGVKSAASWRKACTSNSDCSDLKDGSICAVSYDAAEKRCIPTWWGICHGWAPYALSEPAARNPVTRTASDGTTVTFYPGDLEGLMSLLYTKIPTKFISARCNKDEPGTDASGRVDATECRDMNPGTWHIVVTNLMGLRKQGFVLDQTWDDEVWNQPGWKYQVTNATADGKLVEISKADAIAKLGLDMKMTSLQAATDVAKDAQISGTYTATVAGEHIIKMTGTGDADLHVRKNEAPTLETYDCRPYASTSVEECRLTVEAGDVLFWMANGYADTSNVAVSVGIPGQVGEYTWNTAAKKFFFVEMDFTFIVESGPARQSHVDSVESYASTKHYSYVLEADAYGKIIGGEWVGESMKDHPDFAWWPTGKPTTAMANGLITYAEVKALNDEAMEQPQSQDHVVVIDGYTINTSGAWNSKYASLTIEQGYKTVTFTMTGTGDADLYVRKDRNPTVYTYNCKSVTSGTSAEACSIDLPYDGGLYFVRARTRTPGTTVTVVADKHR